MARDKFCHDSLVYIPLVHILAFIFIAIREEIFCSMVASDGSLRRWSGGSVLVKFTGWCDLMVMKEWARCGSWAWQSLNGKRLSNCVYELSFVRPVAAHIRSGLRVLIFGIGKRRRNI